MNFRKLYANEIDVRVGSVSEGDGVSLLLYKDARCDMNILDETLGTENWQRKHELINGNLFCSVGIYVPERNEWIWKQDVGTESFTEKEKGQASDAFKRACFCLGIGRELYTAPFIWFKASDTKQSGKKCYDKFTVKEIEYDGNAISKLWILDEDTQKSFKWGYGKNIKKDIPTHEPSDEEQFNAEVSKTMKKENKEKATQVQINALHRYAKNHNINLEMIYVSNGCTEDTLSKAQATFLLSSFATKYGD